MASESLAQMALVMKLDILRLISRIAETKTLIEHVYIFVLQNQGSADNISIIIADLGYVRPLVGDISESGRSLCWMILSFCLIKQENRLGKLSRAETEHSV